MNKKQKEIFAAIAVILLVVVIVFFLIRGCSHKYTVDFDTNGGSAINSLKIDKNGLITRPADPTKDGYIFVGWYLNGKKFDFNTKVTGDMKLEARWKLAEAGITLSSTSKTLSIGDTFKLSATLNGDATGATLVYTSSDPSIATVDANGNIKALKAGTVVITVKTADGKYTATCTITVADGKVVEVTNVKVTGNTKMTVGSSQKLKLTISPKDASNKSVTWTSSDKSIATVDKNGNVKALKSGKVTITATAKDGSKKKGSITITIEEAPVVKVSKIVISGNSTMKYGSSQTLSYTVEPANATNKAVTWSVSSGATIDQNGRVTITGDVDQVVITATAQDGSGVTATYTITVEANYVIILTPIDMGDGVTYQNYSYVVTRNGKTFTGYENHSLVVNGNTIFSPTSIAKDVAEAGNSASMTVNGKTVTLSLTRNKL